MLRPEFLFIPLLGFHYRVFFSVFYFFMSSPMPANFSRYIFLLVLGLYDSPLPPLFQYLVLCPLSTYLWGLIVPVFLPCWDVC
jgi:hypothetical protein